ncbi:MAG TPA: hypothetical protein VG943_03265 [Caulobacterales bacterium]|nr:hypothetical protein [Caulobacterales bacterium]
MNNVLWAAIGGGVGAVLGVLVGAFVSRAFPEKWRRGVAMVCAIGLAVFGGSIAGEIGAPHAQATAADIDAQLMQSAEIGTLAHAWKEGDPTSYQAFLQRLAAGANSGQSRADLVEVARAQLMAAAGPRLGRLSDVDTVSFITVVRDEFRELERSRPEACVAMFRGQPFGDITTALSADVRRRELDLMAAAFRANPMTPPEALQGDALQGPLSSVVGSVRDVVGADISMLNPGSNLTGHEARFCEVAATFYDKLAALPAADAAKIMRGLIASADGR